MKLKITILLLAVFTILKTTNAQKAYASTMKIGPFSLGLKNTEVEKICKKKINISELKLTDSNYEKFIDVVVDDINYQLGFFEVYNDDGKSNKIFQINRIKCVSDNVQTKSGITLGMEKFEVLKKLNSMNISYQFIKNKEYDDNGKRTNKFYELIEIIDNDSGSTLILEIKNEKISAFSLSYQSDDC
jgi:hypothetical protein